MIRKIRLLIYLTIVGVAVTIVGITQSVPGSSVATWLGSCRKVSQPAHPALYEQIGQLLRQDDYDAARPLIEKGRNGSTDSTDYYQYEVLLSRYYFCTMQADSLRQTTARLHRFLTSQTGRDDAEYRFLAMNEQMQRGVYEVKMCGHMDSALAHYQQALRLQERLPGCYDERLVLLTNLADVYKQLGQYDQCVNYFHQADVLSDSLGGDTETDIVIFTGIASAQTAMGNFEQSALWWHKADSLRPQMKTGELFHYLNNRGSDYFLQGKYDESLAYFVQLDSLTRTNDDMEWERHFCHANLSHVFIKLHRRNEALRLLDDTERYFTRQQQQLILYYLTTQRMEQALLDGHADEALRLDRESATPAWMIPEQVLLRQQQLLSLYRQTGDWQRLAQVMEQHQQLRDSVMGDKARMQVSVQLLRHDHERTMLDKQRQIEEKELSFRWAMALLVCAAVVIVLLLFISLQFKRQQKLREQSMHSRIASLRMETVHNRITPHFMSNALTSEMLAQMEGRSTDLDSLVQLLQRGIEMTGTEQTTLHDELQFIDFYCGVESRTMGPDFEFRTEVAPDVDPHRVVLPAMFVQILVENALKHGLKPKPRREGQRRTVLVRATRRGDGTLAEVIDNGVGLPAGPLQIEHTGLKVVRQTIQLLNEQNVRQMDYGLKNRAETDGESGCRAWIFLPDDYRYTLLQST